VSKEADGQRWSKYSPDFKRTAVDRVVAGESPTALAGNWAFDASFSMPGKLREEEVRVQRRREGTWRLIRRSTRSRG
jgi:hypothetical protein